MQPTKSNPTVTPPRKVSHRASITGFILSMSSLIFSGMGSLMINAKYTPTGPTTGSVEAEVGHAVATGTTSILGALLGTPFLVVGIVLALIGFVFVVLRLPKVHVLGAIFSIIALSLLVWSLSIAFGAFELIKADPAV